MKKSVNKLLSLSDYTTTFSFRTSLPLKIKNKRLGYVEIPFTGNEKNIVDFQSVRVEIEIIEIIENLLIR